MLRPLRDLLYIIPLEDRGQIGSIIVPDSAKQKVDQGIVKYRGPATTGEVKRGDHVIFSGYDGSQVVTEDDGLLIVMQEEDVIGVYESTDEWVLFTKPQVEGMIQSARDKALAMLIDGMFDEVGVTDYLLEVLQHELDNHLFTELSF